MSQGRLFEIVYLLLEKGKLSAPELAERFEVSVRTIYRDIDALSAAGVPVYSIPGRNGGVALMDHYVLSKAALSDQEQSQLLTALHSLSGTLGSDSEETLSKLSGLFQRQEPQWLEVDLSRWGGKGRDQAIFDLLREAILSRKEISFTYAGSYGSPASRRVLPAKLVFKGQAWYLQGLCLDKESYRTFKLSRIRDLTMTEHTFPAPLFPPPIDREPPPSCPTVRLSLRCSPALAYRIYDEFEPEQITALDDGSFRVEAEFPEDNWVYGYLLSFGPMIEVLEPERVRNALGKLAGQILSRCENPATGYQGLGAIMRPSHLKEDTTMTKENTPFCQSCSMPLTDDLRGSEADGSPSKHYCKYCYSKGKFTGDMTMEQMIDFCAPLMAKTSPGMTEADARKQMEKFFPQLLRWKKAEQ